jgi:hypothetical protein
MMVGQHDEVVAFEDQPPSPASTDGVARNLQLDVSKKQPGTPLSQNTSAQQLEVVRLQPAPTLQTVLTSGTKNSDSLVMTKHDKPLAIIKPYCGARATTVLEIENTRLGTRDVHGKGVPVWADVGFATHLRGAVVPVVSSTTDVESPKYVDHLDLRFNWRRYLYRKCVILLSILENIMCYLAFFEMKAPSDHFYNKVDAHIMNLPGLGMTLLVLAAVDSALTFLFLAAIIAMEVDIYRAASMVRLPLSACCTAICFALTLFGEQTKIFPFLQNLFALLSLEVFLLYGTTVLDGGGQRPESVSPAEPKKKKRPSRQDIDAEAKRRLSQGNYFFPVIVGLFTLIWCLLFASDKMVFARNENCLATRNRAMPVRVDGVAEWQCAKWGATHYIKRLPDLSEPIFDGFCSTTFNVFDSPSPEAGVMVPSTKAHRIRCPDQCQTLELGIVTGCEVYDARSSVCAAAVQMGLLEPDVGGIVTVVGRTPLTQYERCNQHGVKSMHTRVPGLEVSYGLSSNVTATGWAFYFQVPATRHLDEITLHSNRGKDGVSAAANAPYTRYVADVSWVVGGIARQEDVTIGPNEGAPIELNFCRGADDISRDCL